MSDRDAIAEAIIVLRRRLGLNQKEFAEKAQISTAHMSRIERGKVEAKRRTLERVAEALGLSLADLLRFCEELGRSRKKSLAAIDHYPFPVPSSRRHPSSVAEEKKRVEYFLGLDEEDS